MPKWTEVDLGAVEVEPGSGRSRARFTLAGGPLKFQIPRGVCMWGVSPEYKSFQVTIQDETFGPWFESLEKKLVSETPFRSNYKGGQLRLKVDDGTLFFKADGTMIVDGAERMKGADVSCIMEITGPYFFNECHGLTCRAAQVRIWAEPEPAVIVGSCSPVTALPRRALLDD